MNPQQRSQIAFNKFKRCIVGELKDESIGNLLQEQYDNTNPHFLWSAGFLQLIESSNKLLSSGPSKWSAVDHFLNEISRYKAQPLKHLISTGATTKHLTTTDTATSSRNSSIPNIKSNSDSLNQSVTESCHRTEVKSKCWGRVRNVALKSTGNKQETGGGCGSGRADVVIIDDDDDNDDVIISNRPFDDEIRALQSLLYVDVADTSNHSHSISPSKPQCTPVMISDVIGKGQKVSILDSHSPLIVNNRVEVLGIVELKDNITHAQPPVLDNQSRITENHSRVVHTMSQLSPRNKTTARKRTLPVAGLVPVKCFRVMRSAESMIPAENTGPSSQVIVLDDDLQLRMLGLARRL